MTLDELPAIRAAEVESPSGFDDLPLEVEGGMAFDLPRLMWWFDPRSLFLP
jgi:hypothetical protein